jgi:hypothetical protein
MLIGQAGNTLLRKAAKPMGEEHELQEQPAQVPDDTEQQQAPGKSFDPTIYLLALLTILTLSLVYFFVAFLPNMQREQQARENELHSRRQQLQASYQACVNTAEADYERYIKRNGTPVTDQPGAFAAPDYIWETADNNRQAALDACLRLYPH